MTISERLRTASVHSAEHRGNESPRLGEFGSFIGCKWITSGDAVDVRSPYDNSLVAVVHRATVDQICAAIEISVEAFQKYRKFPVWKRAEALERISASIFFMSVFPLAFEIALQGDR